MRKFHRAPALIFLLVATGSAQAPLGFGMSGELADSGGTPPFVNPDPGTPLQLPGDLSPQTDTFINAGPTSDPELTRALDTLVASTTPLDLPTLFTPQNQDFPGDKSLTPTHIDPQPDPQIDPGPELPPPGGDGPVAGGGGGGAGIFDAPAAGDPGNGKSGGPGAPGTPVPEPTGLWMVAGAMLSLFRPRARRV